MPYGLSTGKPSRPPPSSGSSSASDGRDLDYVHATAHRSLLAKRDQEMTEKIEMTVAGVLKFFVQEKHNDLSAEAIATFLDKPEFYPVSAIAQALARFIVAGMSGGEA
jgi:hypothetical protein